MRRGGQGQDAGVSRGHVSLVGQSTANVSVIYEVTALFGVVVNVIDVQDADIGAPA